MEDLELRRWNQNSPLGIPVMKGEEIMASESDDASAWERAEVVKFSLIGLTFNFSSKDINELVKSRNKCARVTLVQSTKDKSHLYTELQS